MTTSASEGAALTTPSASHEHADLLQALAVHRGFLRFTATGLTEAQAALTPTVSALSIVGLVKHVSFVERAWTAFIIDGAAGMDAAAPAETDDRLDAFRLMGAETLQGLLDDYEQIAQKTTDIVSALPDLDGSHPLPVAPWFEPGASWTARRVLLHLIAETAQHAGHADIIRETIDGAKTMG